MNAAENRIYHELLRIFREKIEKSLPLDDHEKQIVRNAKQMPDKSPTFEHLCGCFFESDLK